ncbi:MAG TPA: hypothetical protein VJS44_07345, partial [Pyrinomonadaceae bacterium]|nr:hypothetical protein [Pyrinomonadaceae bacterium]
MRAIAKWRLVIAALCIFFTALGVRLLSWQDARWEAEKVQWVVAGDYKRIARLMQEGGAASFFSSTSPLADPDNLGHPP